MNWLDPFPNEGSLLCRHFDSIAIVATMVHPKFTIVDKQWFMLMFVTEQLGSSSTSIQNLIASS